MPDRLPSRAFRFGGFVLDVSAYELRKQGRSIKVERRPMELLMLLVDRRGELVTRDEIVDRLWGRDVFIDIDTSVNTVIRKIRRALRDSADHSRFIQTVQGKGYRFIADVEPATGAVLAVLPFENLQGDADQDYVADGLTEETIVGLGQIDPERLSVIGRTSSMAYRRTTKTLNEIGRELGVDYLLEGSVRDGEWRLPDDVQADSGARPGADLDGNVRARRRTICSDCRPSSAEPSLRQIELRLSPQRTATMARRQTQNPEAYDLYLRGRYYYNQMTPATGARALDCFYRATTLDPAYALAWAGIADTYSSRLFNSDTRPSDVSDQARAAAKQALENGGTVAEAHTAVATGSVSVRLGLAGRRGEPAPCGCARSELLAELLDARSRDLTAGTARSGARCSAACAGARSAQRLDPQHVLADRVLRARLRSSGAHAREALLCRAGFLGRHTGSLGKRTSRWVTSIRPWKRWRKRRGCPTETPSRFRFLPTRWPQAGASAKPVTS